MMTGEEDVSAQALFSRGWSISAIARHLGRDRKTIRAYVAGERIPGVRKPAGPDVFADFSGYVAARFRDDPHVPLTTLHDELVELGYARSYPSFTRVVRDRGLRPTCPRCVEVGGRATVEIDHPPGDECQWDWVELPGAPWLPAGAEAHLLVGVLAFSGRARAVFADAEDQPHLIDALDGVSRRLGGIPRAWRFDRMGTVVQVGTDRVVASFAEAAKHYAVEVRVCPPYRGNRKGVVEKAIDFLTQRWWRRADVATVGEAQASLDRFLAGPGDARVRRHEGRRTTVGELAAAEGLAAVPPRAYPAEITREATVARDATVAFDGNRYGVPPSLIGQPVIARHRLGSQLVAITTPAGLVAASHERTASGAGRLVRTDGQRAALETVVLQAAGQQGRPCRHKTHRPPGETAKAEADRLRRHETDDAVVIDLSVYQAHIDGLDTTAPAPATTTTSSGSLADPCGCLGGTRPHGDVPPDGPATPASDGEEDRR